MVVVTSKHVLGNPPGSRAVVYEHYKLGSNHFGISLIFQNGSYDGFCERSIEICEINPVRLDRACMDYDFTNVGVLVDDFHAGVFASAFRPVS
jgi:hypothetical protein